MHDHWRWRYYLVLFVFYILVTMLSERGFEAIMRITPIDTSEARTNWRSSVGQPIASKAGFVPGQGGSTAGQAYAIAGREFAGALGQYRIGRRFFFRNNAGHIEDLEMPTVKSRQAPGGILGPTVNFLLILLGIHQLTMDSR